MFIIRDLGGVSFKGFKYLIFYEEAILRRKISTGKVK